MAEIQFWLTDQELENIFSNEYWNCEEKERKSGISLMEIQTSL